ncbi:MAG: L,D-transpeptidase [Pegethrix bostrychoides GSE-TBD4-15B]|uniref:L,D-transpeptidase n=1 Tax=Pegethrix bostrychoides GSE-TBD4-15B TaxID=2839662 RepID=A0A951PBU2_9CYAN|nr:L,D-transpeptidase [Pegethrix bostrychoides GSE-TBD4-15B]
MRFLQFSQICLSSAFLLSAQAATFAQFPAQTLSDGARSAIPRPRLSIPELPPIQPVWPEPVEAPVRLVLSRSDRRLYLYRGSQQVRSYPVAVGKSGWETPLGTWAVNNMLEHPSWEHPFTGEIVPPGPDNPLGERWIGFWTNGRSYIGFHGTPTRDSIGRAASHGCVRMFNEDIRELYGLVQLGTPVVVQP